MKSYRFKVIGRVQGVWFRKFTKDVADRLGVKGYVRNLDDGSVEIVASFDDEMQFEKFLEAVKKGPPLARVDEILIEEIEEVPAFNDFRIVK